MTKIKKLASAAAIATLALVATDLSASAQSTLTNGPNGAQPNTLASDTPSSPQGKDSKRAMTSRRPMQPMASGAQHSSYAYRRPLTVRRTTTEAVVAAPVVAAPVVVANTGPGTFVTGPLGFGSSIVALPFRGLNTIFPATGDIATNPLLIIGGPLHAMADLAQVPFRVIGAPFGGTTIATY